MRGLAQSGQPAKSGMTCGATSEIRSRLGADVWNEWKDGIGEGTLEVNRPPGGPLHEVFAWHAGCKWLEERIFLAGRESESEVSLPSLSSAFAETPAMFPSICVENLQSRGMIDATNNQRLCKFSSK